MKQQPQLKFCPKIRIELHLTKQVILLSIITTGFSILLFHFFYDAGSSYTKSVPNRQTLTLQMLEFCQLCFVCSFSIFISFFSVNVDVPVHMATV